MNSKIRPLKRGFQSNFGYGIGAVLRLLFVTYVLLIIYSIILIFH